MNEFDIIKTYFAPLSKDGLVNDAAVIDIPQGHQLVVTSDTLNAGTHFMANANADQIAHKALRVNVSDLYAMGAAPLCYQLNIAYPEKPTDQWLAAFTSALKDDQGQFGIYCSGGDTTSINGALSISITAMGLVKTGAAWGRDGAKEGDAVVLSGAIGDAWIGLQVLRGDLKTNDDGYFIDTYYKPSITPFSAKPNTTIDVSDGFAADLSHICKKSDIGAIIDTTKIPFSQQAQTLLDQGAVTYEQLLTGGDDYALLMAIDPAHVTNTMHVIGTFTGAELILKDQNDKTMNFDNTGWTHF